MLRARLIRWLARLPKGFPLAVLLVVSHVAWIASPGRLDSAEGTGSVASEGSRKPASAKSASSKKSANEKSPGGGSPATRSTDSRYKQSQYDNGAGIEARAGFLGFQTFGRDDSLGYVEMLPYLMADDEMLFSDLRGFVSTEGMFGGNAGFGYRRWLGGIHRVAGASLWYDGDDTTGMLFHQLGLSLESYGRIWDFRGNFYLPIIETEHSFGDRAVDLRFSGNRILYDRQTRVQEAMPGLDLEIGFLLPSEVAHEFNLRAFAGWYYFQGDKVDDINGYRVRLEGNMTRNISTQIELTDDQTYGQNLMLGIAIQFSGGLHRDTPRGVSKMALMRRFVQRNYNIIAPRQTHTAAGLEAINPLTGAPYEVRHVASGAGGIGTADDPYATIAAAQSDNPDLIFVHADSVFSEAVILNEGERVLGEGVEHAFELPGFGTRLLPRATDGIDRPLLQSINGDAVTLASGAEFSGFTINSPTGRGIVGDAIDGAAVRNVQIFNAGGAGISLLDSRGPIGLANFEINDAIGPGFHVDGGRPNVTFSGSIDNDTGFAVQITDTTRGVIDLSGASIHGQGGNGILVQDADGDVIFGDVTVRNSVGAGILVQGGEGDTTFAGRTLVRNASAAGVEIRDTEGTVSFAELDVISNGQTALLARNASQLEIANGTLEGRSGGAAADIEDSRTSILLRSVFADGGPFGLRIVNSTGGFVVYGGENAGSGGMIQNATTGVLLDNAATVAFQFLDLDNNSTALQATDVRELVVVRSRVTDSTVAGLSLVDVRRLELTHTEFSNNTGSSLRAVFETDRDYSYTIARNVIDDESAAALSFTAMGGGVGSTLSLDINTNEITTRTAGADAINVNWNGILAASITNNVFTIRQQMGDAIDITNSSTAELTEIVVNQNAFMFRDENSTGLRVATAGASRVTAGANEMIFNGSNGTGMNFTLAQSANVNLFNNVITDNVASGTGILFDTIAGPSTVAISGNVLNLLSGGAAIDRGIIFNNVTDILTLSSTANNVVNGATTPFFIPGGAATTNNTTILVNGVRLP